MLAEQIEVIVFGPTVEQEFAVNINAMGSRRTALPTASGVATQLEKLGAKVGTAARRHHRARQVARGALQR